MLNVCHVPDTFLCSGGCSCEHVKVPTLMKLIILTEEDKPGWYIK